MLPRIEYSVVVPVPPALAFRAFTDLGRLLERGIYEEAAWVEGKPWRVGSRIRYVVVKPIQATISAVVNSSDPPRSIGLLNHSLGITAEQQVSFEALAQGRTRVRMSVEFVGKSPQLPDDVIHHAISFLTKDALDTMAARCQVWNESGTPNAPEHP